MLPDVLHKSLTIDRTSYNVIEILSLPDRLPYAIVIAASLIEPELLKSMRRLGNLTDLFRGEALPRVDYVAEVMTAEWSKQCVNVIRRYDAIRQHASTSIEVCERTLYD